MNELEKIKRGYMDHRGEDEKHESFGTVSVHRVSGRADLFDVSSPQQHFMSLKISRAVRYRSLSQDRVHSYQEVVEVFMSETQFARLLSSVGVGEGVPCTINRVEGKPMEPPPPRDMGERLKTDLKKKSDRVSTLLAEMAEQLEELMADKTVSKKKLKEFQQRMFHARKGVDDEMPFVLTQAVEQLEDARMEAKANIDAYQQHQALRLGLEARDKAIAELEPGDEED